MAALSSKALKPYYAENKYKFNSSNELQSKEFSDGSGLELYDAIHRMYDPQIGRFGQADPYSDVFSGWSPYSFANNDPTLLNDPDGLLSDSANPQKLTPVIVTRQKRSSTIIIDSRPSKRNPDFKFGANTPFYVHYNPNEQDPNAVDVSDNLFRGAVIVGSNIPIIGQGIRFIYAGAKALQYLRGAKEIPESAQKAVKDIKNGVPRPGYRGGRMFQNDGRNGCQRLPETDADGNPITYKEYDVNPKVQGQDRGAERVVYGTDGKAYYTDDHYKTFTEIKP
jgi:RHS repeat-associated protein